MAQTPLLCIYINIVPKKQAFSFLDTESQNKKCPLISILHPTYINSVMRESLLAGVGEGSHLQHMEMRDTHVRVTTVFVPLRALFVDGDW